MVMSNLHQVPISVSLVPQLSLHVHHHNPNNVRQWDTRLLGALVYYVPRVQLQIVLKHVCKMVITILVTQQCKVVLLQVVLELLALLLVQSLFLVVINLVYFHKMLVPIWYHANYVVNLVITLVCIIVVH